jgi:hypothetical protein
VFLRPRSQDFKELDIVVLRHELSVLRRQTRRPQLTTADRVFLAAASRLLIPLQRLYVLLHRARQPTRPPGWLHREPDGRVGHPAGPLVRVDAAGAAIVVSLPDPQPRRQVHPRLRRRLRQRRHQDHQDTRPSTEGERDRRALRPHRPRRMPRLATDHESTPSRACPPRLRRSLQHSQAARLVKSRIARAA